MEHRNPVLGELHSIGATGNFWLGWWQDKAQRQRDDCGARHRWNEAGRQWEACRSKQSAGDEPKKGRAGKAAAFISWDWFVR